MPMMALGQFLFGLDTLAFQQLQRQSDWRHPTNSRVGAMPARQFTGPGEDKITLTGLQVPEFRGDRHSLDQLRKMADAGKAYALVGGDGAQGSAPPGDEDDEEDQDLNDDPNPPKGTVFGAFVITGVQETGTLFIAEGVARRTEFTLELARVDDVRAEPDGGADDGDDGWADDEDYWDWWLG